MKPIMLSNGLEEMEPSLPAVFTIAAVMMKASWNG